MRASTSISYGSSGTLKTTEIGRLARYYHKLNGKKTRLISADGGGWDCIADCIDDGIVEPYHITMLANPVETMRKLSRGDWPVAEGSKAVLRPTVWEKANIGVYAIEGLTSIGNMIMRALRLRGAKIGESPNYSFTEGSETVFGANQSYYGFVQDFLLELVINSGALPVHHVHWTALESRGEDDTRQPVYGPAIAGKKSIAAAPGWFGDCLHHDSVTVEVKDKDGKPSKDEQTGAKITKEQFRVYFTRHPDPATGIVYPAKIRVPAAKLGDLLKDPKFKNGYYEPTLTGGMDWLLEMEEKLRRGQDKNKV